MENLQPRTRTFLVNGLGYVAGAVVGYLAIYLLGQFGLVDFLFNLVEEGQTFLQLLAIPLIAWFMLALGGMITGGIGGWILSSSIGTENRGKIIGGSSVAFAGSTGILIMLFLILTSFIALYNNLTTGKIEQFGILFGLYGLIFGLLTGLFQAFTTVRLRHTWRVILASTLGFAAGGILAGLIIRWINPLDGLETTPILTTLLLLLALALPYFIGGGALGLAYLSIARRTVEAGEEIETAQSPIWQIAVVGLIALFIIIPVLNLVDKVAGFLTIQPANLQSQITSETTGVRWSDPVLVAGGVKIMACCRQGARLRPSQELKSRPGAARMALFSLMMAAEASNKSISPPAPALLQQLLMLMEFRTWFGTPQKSAIQMVSISQPVYW